MRDNFLRGFLTEKCGACGLDRGSHHGASPEWCPAHAKRMDWQKTTIFEATGEHFALDELPSYGTPALNGDGEGP